eukprot:NODE_1186_length_1655_cov_36.720423_g1053_i0.p1 GENE.NODE_1186_length_1655_cov_36.720423_g1053_i0~~NODE_1186_length_1655_cov_36.720423_g1053_i0.p1  ORF type:complete len:488 (+),score=68.87 NODE_1186_length_1655_cov_36.720423_g1053_i0:99-1466(+)
MSKRGDTIRSLVLKQAKRARDVFINSYGLRPDDYNPAKRLKVDVKMAAEYGVSKEGEEPQPLLAKKGTGATKLITGFETTLALPAPSAGPGTLVAGPQKPSKLPESTSNLQVLPVPTSVLATQSKGRHREAQWHPQWKIMKVLTGHVGWVRTIAIDWTNEWFVSAGDDRVIKVWDLASGHLKLTLTGHVGCVKGLAISKRSPYLFSVGEDKMVKCWDLETNKVIRHYHGHLSGAYCCALHPSLDLLATGGRDATVRIWDIRTKNEVHTLMGHNHTVHSVASQDANPQIISGSQDNTIRLWDLVKGASYKTLTNHKKGIRALLVHPTEYTFASGGADNIKKWKCPEGEFMTNFRGHESIIHSLAINHDNVLVSGGDNGTIKLWDWSTAVNFQTIDTVAQPGSLESESAVFAAEFDHSGTRLLTAEADKTIKIWREDPNSTPETHPVKRADGSIKRF